MSNNNDYWDNDFIRHSYHFGEEGQSGSNFSGGNPGGVFKFVVNIIIVLIVLALLLGVGMPGAVWSFFGKIILVVGFFALLDKLFG